DVMGFSVVLFCVVVESFDSGSGITGGCHFSKQHFKDSCVRGIGQILLLLDYWEFDGKLEL
ncbi:hypothetical protein Droror1_Dr00016597, partial [Drosera rotundifolia]